MLLLLMCLMVEKLMVMMWLLKVVWSRARCASSKAAKARAEYVRVGLLEVVCSLRMLL